MKFKPKNRKIIINLLFVAALIISVLGIYVGLQIFLATSTPIVSVASGSMHPSYEVGDLVIIQGVPPTDIQEGDVIVFDPPEGASHLTVHRVLRIEPTDEGTLQFRTKGDANANEDPSPVPENLVHGRVIYRIPYLGYITLDPTITIILIIIIAMVLLLWPRRTRKFPKKRKLFFLLVVA